MASLVSTKNTLAAISIIQRQLKKTIKIVDIVIQISFILYYGFLIFSNIDHIGYLVLYSIMTAISITVFILSFVLSKKKENENHIETERRKSRNKLIKNIFKYIKYAIKLTVIIIAFYEIATVDNSSTKIILTVISIILLIIQIILDFAVMLLLRWIDYLKIAIKEDIESSSILKLGGPSKLFHNFTSKMADKMEGVEKYTEKEKNILSDIEEEKSIQEQNKKDKKKRSLHDNITRIKASMRSNYVLKKTDKEKIDKEYFKRKEKALSTIKSNKKIQSIIKKAKEDIKKVPSECENLSKVPFLCDVLERYVDDNNFISEDCALSIIAGLSYLNTTYDIIPDFLSIGYEDDDAIMGLVIQENFTELNSLDEDIFLIEQ